MKYLFCGLGSIGERHLSNLLTFGENDIIAYRKNSHPLRFVKKRIKTLNYLPGILKQKPDVAFITNPTAYHIQLAIELAKNGCHLFIEKPLSSSLKGVNELYKICKRKKLIVFTGFMMRYHPAAIQIKKWLNTDAIGFPISVRMTCGEYLPLWHPWENYSKSYSARKEMGGGPIFTLCHEFDLLSWFFNQPNSVFSFKSRNSTLKLSTEHTVEILLQYKNGLIAEVHLDYLQNPPDRNWQIIGDKGKIEFDYYKNQLILYNFNENKEGYRKKLIDFTGKFKRNDMFMAEMERFLISVRKLEKPEISLIDGINNLKILISAHKSIKEKRIIELREIKIC